MGLWTGRGFVPSASKTGIRVRVSRVRIPPCPLRPVWLYPPRKHETHGRLHRPIQPPLMLRGRRPPPRKDSRVPRHPENHWRRSLPSPERTGEVGGDVRCLPCLRGNVTPKVLQGLALIY